MNNATIYEMASKRFLVIMLFFVIGNQVYAQLDKPDSTQWNEGKVMLADGTSITGSMWLNTRTGLLAYENGPISRSLTANKVLAFEFLDGVTRRHRSFISLPYDGPESSGTNKKTGTHQYFEILMEFKKFVLMSAFEKLAYSSAVMGSPNPHGGPVPTVTKLSQTETLFILDSDEKLTPLLRITDNLKEIESPYTDVLTKTKAKSQQSKTKTKNIGSEVLENITAPHFEKLKVYAESNNLSFKIKDDLLKIFEYYKTID